MTWIFIEPSDVWLFRDGRPFSAGEEHSARCVFPPHPTTIQGVIRSLMLGHSSVGWDEFRDQQSEEAQELARAIGCPSTAGRPASLGVFAIAGPFLAQRADDKVIRQIPLPADVVCAIDDPRACFALRPRRDQPFETIWSAKTLAPLWPPGDEHIVSPPGAPWLPEIYIDDYFSGRAFPLIPATSLFEREPRFGIAMDYSKGSARDQMLYQAEFVRPSADVGLLVWVNDKMCLPDAVGVLAIGGETRGARYTTLPDDTVFACEPAKPANRIKLVLLTPAYFSAGWQPADGDDGWSRLIGQPVRLIAAAVSAPQMIGGWDVAARWHKPMVACVPAGSVYFLEADQPFARPAAPITETPEGELSFGPQGFGQVVAGPWDWLDI